MKNLVSMPTVEYNTHGQRFLAYIDPESVIGIEPILESRYGNWVEVGSTIILQGGATVRTVNAPSYAAAALAAALRAHGVEVPQ